MSLEELSKNESRKQKSEKTPIQILNPKRLPNEIRNYAPWLNDTYIKKYAWIPSKNHEVCKQYELHRSLEIPPPAELYDILGFSSTEWGVFPIRDFRTIKQKDLVIFLDYDDIRSRQRYNPDSFMIVCEEMHEEILDDELEVPEDAIIVPYPEKTL